jgi:hypothetical protein
MFNLLRFICVLENLDKIMSIALICAPSFIISCEAKPTTFYYFKHTNALETIGK